MNEFVFTFITDLLLPISISTFICIILTHLKGIIGEKNLNKLVLTAIKAVEQYLKEEDGYSKLEAVKDHVMARVDVDEDDLILLIESLVFEMNKEKLKE